MKRMSAFSRASRDGDDVRLIKAYWRAARRRRGRATTAPGCQRQEEVLGELSMDMIELGDLVLLVEGLIGQPARPPVPQRSPTA